MNRTELVTAAIAKNSLMAASLREVMSIAELCLFAVQHQKVIEPGFPDIQPALLRIITEVSRTETLLDEQEMILSKGA